MRSSLERVERSRDTSRRRAPEAAAWEDDKASKREERREKKGRGGEGRERKEKGRRVGEERPGSAEQRGFPRKARSAKQYESSAAPATAENQREAPEERVAASRAESEIRNQGSGLEPRHSQLREKSAVSKTERERLAACAMAFLTAP